jgi:hypothetical protein
MFITSIFHSIIWAMNLFITLNSLLIFIELVIDSVSTPKKHIDCLQQNFYNKSNVIRKEFSLQWPKTLFHETMVNYIKNILKNSVGTPIDHNCDYIIKKQIKIKFTIAILFLRRAMKKEIFFKGNQPN